MSKGKEICNELKAVRRRIADENGIMLEIPECNHNGPCPGSCPRCESEMRYLEHELARRISVGKVATVAGLALTLTLSAQAQDTPQTPSTGGGGIHTSHQEVVKLHPVSGTIIDAKTKEPIPFCNVTVLPMEDKNGLTTHLSTTTDFDGIFKMDLPEGNYTLRVAYIGYKSIERPLKVTAKNDTIEIGMEMTATVLGMPEVIICGIHNDPIIEIGPEGATNTEIQGVPLKVQY